MTKHKGEVELETALEEEVELSDRYLLWMIGRFLRPYLWQIVWVFVLLIGVTGLTLLLPLLVQKAVDGPIANNNLDGLIPIGAIYLGVVFATFVLRFWHIYLLQTVGQNALMNLRQQLFEHIIKQDFRFFSKTPVGLIVSRMSNDIEALTEVLSTSIVLVASNMVTLIGIVIVMFLVNWRLALFGLSVLPIMIVATAYFRAKIRRASSRFHKIMGEYHAFLNEKIGGMLIVQLFGRQDISRAEFDKVNRDYYDVHTAMRDQYTWYASALQIMTTLGLAVVLYGGGQGVLAKWASLGILIAFIEYTRRSFEPILMLSEQFAQIQTALSAGERIARMLKVEPEIQEPAHPVRIEHFQQALSFEDVTFSYKGGHPVLREINLHIQPGTRVAIVGATGAGKTSLVKLISRYYDVDCGAVKIDGVDVRELAMPDLRRFVTVVPQNPYCFNGTIADNLRLWDESITLEQMKQAAEIAHAAPFIERLPGAYDYQLLPGGANLSQGQRQLLALARALIHSPESILVLDEATSSIDTETEVLIQKGLEHVLAGRTSVTIAHRLSTIRDADRILVMHRGRIVEDGSHAELLARDGVYKQLYRRQFYEGEEAIEDVAWLDEIIAGD